MSFICAHQSVVCVSSLKMIVDDRMLGYYAYARPTVA